MRTPQHPGPPSGRRPSGRAVLVEGPTALVLLLTAPVLRRAAGDSGPRDAGLVQWDVADGRWAYGRAVAWAAVSVASGVLAVLLAGAASATGGAGLDTATALLRALASGGLALMTVFLLRGWAYEARPRRRGSPLLRSTWADALVLAGGAALAAA